MYIWLGLCIALALLLVTYGLTSLVVAAIWRVLSRRSSLPGYPNLLFAIRVFPVVASLALVLFVAVPAYWTFEPYETRESVSPGLAVAAATAIVGIGLALYRVARMAALSRRLTKEWIRAATPLRLEGLPIAAYRLEHEFPLLAITGIMHPRLFVANRLLESLSREQMAAALAHELGHLAARDNLRRFLLCLLPAPIFADGMDRSWAVAAERAADSYAVRQGSESALDLASALIQVARMAPEGLRAASLPCVQLLATGDPAVLADRVEHLVALAERELTTSSPRDFRRDLARYLAWALGTVGLFSVWMSPACLRIAHEFIERFVLLMS